ncbi:PQQ-dependent sugar dehydrogenase [Cryobacterium soli]|uniref:PQQ-dependent sugar dehydrogenase n=1 Tax=Cryobacterium soli TaxID=2220095 RepID=UPI000E72942D|nr:PQQ-dependent sugar dehydrogenase [Cryobacterium soli]
MHHRRVWGGLVAASTVALLCACAASAPRLSVSSSTPAQPTPEVTSTAPATASAPAPVHPVGDPVVIAEGLDVPWSILRLPSGATLISERDTALVRELLPDGSLRDAATVAGVVPNGEGGLLGLAYLPGDDDTGWVYAYFTAASDNRIVRMPVTGAAGSLGLGEPESVLTGIPAAGNHNGGRLEFGPDGMLYATAGDAGNTGNAQNLDSLGGKILRMTPTGEVPADNPFGTLVYSFGHRNPQGLAWDSAGQLWASEFGQNTWDELNLITAGANYGWPEVEGIGQTPGFTDPVQQWSTDEASPSGLASVGDTLFLAALGGERMWRVDSSTGTVDDWFVNSFGRLRDVVSGPGSTLWFVTNNTDGRGSPSPGDDRLYQVQVAP